MHWGDGCYGGGHGFHWILFGILILLVVKMLCRWGRCGRGSHYNHCRETPEETLKRRYAAGLVSREDYEKILEDLKK